MSELPSRRVVVWVQCDGCGEDVDTFERDFASVRNLLDSTSPRRGHRQCIDPPFRYHGTVSVTIRKLGRLEPPVYDDDEPHQ